MTYLTNIPVYEYAIILGENWFTTEWNPSKQLVWDNGEACLIPLTNVDFVSASRTFSYTLESASKM